MISSLKDKINRIDKKYLIGGALFIGITATGIFIYLKNKKTLKTPETPLEKPI